MKYDEALKELQAIVGELESNPTDIETLCGKLKRAQELIALCKDKLSKTEEELKQMLDKEQQDDNDK